MDKVIHVSVKHLYLNLITKFHIPFVYRVKEDINYNAVKNGSSTSRSRNILNTTPFLVNKQSSVSRMQLKD